jgi:D-aminopeptidase
VALGIGRVGSYAAHGSGEIVVGFSTSNVIPRRTRKMVTKVKFLLDQRLDPLYEAVMEATEEAILNSMCMAGPMTGINGNHCPALPLEEVRRLVEAVRPALGFRKRSPPAPADKDREGTVKVADALPTAVRGAEGIPFPTRPPDGSDA